MFMRVILTVLLAVCSGLAFADVVATPTFTPSPGTYTGSVAVTLDCATAGATIYYTTDGTDPDVNATVYTTPIVLNASTTVKAYATAAGLNDSPIASGDYVVQQPVAAPQLTPAAGTFVSTVTVAINCSTPGASIYYTTNGVDPDATANLYAGPVTLTTTTVLKAIACETGMTDSPIVGGTYTILQPVATPTFAPVPGTYQGGVTVTLACATPGATIYYTTDGTTPDANATAYTAPVNLLITTTLKAIGIKSGMADSVIASAVYTIGNLAVTAPNGGERWCQGTKRSITWTPTGDVGTNVKIELFKGGVLDSVIAPSCAASASVFTWTIPTSQTPATNYRVKITSLSAPVITVTSDNNFEIYTPVGPPVVPMFRQNPQGNSQGHYSGPTTGGVKWRFTALDGGQFSSSAVGFDGTIYAASDGGHLYAVYPDGTEKWEYPIDAPASNASLFDPNGLMQMISSPAIAQDGTIFVGSWSGKLYALDPFGQLKWTFKASGALVSPIIAPNGNIIVGSMDKSVYALDQLGNKLWSYQTAAPVSYCPAIAADGTIYVAPRNYFGNTTDNSLLYALAANGTLKWTYDTQGVRIGTAPAVASDGTVYIGVGPNSVFAINPDSSKKWQFDIPQGATVPWSRQGSAIGIGTDGSVIFGCCDQRIHSLKKDTGVENWNHQLGTAHIHSGFVLGQNGTIYGVDSNGTFDALNPVDGTELWSATLDMMNYNAPCIDASGVMYVGGSKLTAVGPRFYKADALIKRSTDSTFVGGGVYNTTGANQTVAQTISGTSIGVYNIKLQNNGNAPDTFVVSGPAGNANWAITYLDSTSQDITAQVTGGGWTSPQVPDGAAYDLQLQVSDIAAVDGSATDVLTLVTSGNDPTSQDAVLAHTTLQMVPVAAPTFTPVPGVYTGGVTVTITCATPGAILRYTTDGTTPTATSALYTVPIVLNATTTLKAAGYVNKMADSPVTTGTYTVGVSTPVLTPPPGAYTDSVTVAITCTTAGATIRYTTDGTNPTASSTVYTVPIVMTTTTVLKAGAFKAGLSDSAVAGGTYNLSVATPAFAPAPGTYTGPTAVSLSCVTPGAIIRYTTDGTDPTAVSTLYTAPVILSVTTTLKAKAFKAGMTDSLTATGLYTIAAQTPVLTPPPGPYIGATTVTITCPTPGATIRYTTDGTVPTATSTVYTGPVTLTATTMLQAYATVTGLADSAVAGGTYAITVNTPVFAPLPGLYVGSVAVAITCATPGAAIRYTTDGTDPTAASTLYAGPVTLSATTNLQARAFKTGLATSAAAAGLYTLAVNPPVLTPGSGNYTGSVTVTMTSLTPGAAIHYTTDGSAPTAASPLYTTPVTFSAITTVKAYALKTGMTASDIVSAIYPVAVSTPVFTPAPGGYTNSVSVAIGCPGTSGATIRYTTDGTDPTALSPVYASPFPLLVTTTVKAKAFKTGMADSAIATGAYSIFVATPTFSPAPNTYTGSVDVSLACATAGATIRYTTNGIDPSSTSTLYTGPVHLTENTVVKARAFYPGMTDSVIAPGAYNIIVATPAITPVAGMYLQSVTISAASQTPGATLRYTLDTTDPTATSPICSGPLLLTANLTLKVRGFKSNMLPSAVTSAGYTILTQQTAMPSFSVASGTYAKTVTVAISCGTPGATIRYTTNGNDPTVASALYSSAVAINGTVTLKARAYKNGMADSNVATADYSTSGDIYEPDDTSDKAKVITNGETQNRTLNINTDTDWVKFTLTVRSEVRIETNGTVGDTEMWLYGPNNATTQIAYNDDYNRKFSCIYRLGNDALAAGTYYIKVQPYAHLNVVPNYTLSFHATASQQTATPSYSPAPGSFSAPVAVTITSNTPGTSILYTTDGTDPVGSSRLYTGPITLKTTTVLKARAFKNGLAVNNEAVGTYTIMQTVATPVLTPASGVYSSPVSVVITCATAGAQIRYTTNGTEPTSTSTLYTAPLSVTTTTTVKAKAFFSGMADSLTAAGSYTITVKSSVAAPLFTPAPGTYANAVYVSLSCATAGASVRYTTNGSEPTATSTPYVSPMRISAATTIKAKAFLSNMTDSATTTAPYVVGLTASLLGVQPAVLTTVRLTAQPASAAFTGTPVTLAAAPTGGVNVTYAFWIATQQANGAWSYAELRAAGPPATCSWTPQAPGSYLLIVDAQEAGATTGASIAIPYTVVASK